MLLKELINNLPIRKRNIEITGLETNSKKIKKGFIFFAIKGHKFRVVRDEKVLSENSLDSLKRFKDDVKEVASGFECGISVEDTLDIKQGDILEIFTHDKIAQTI